MMNALVLVVCCATLGSNLEGKLKKCSELAERSSVTEVAQRVSADFESLRSYSDWVDGNDTVHRVRLIDYKYRMDDGKRVVVVQIGVQGKGIFWKDLDETFGYSTRLRVNTAIHRLESLLMAVFVETEQTSPRGREVGEVAQRLSDAAEKRLKLRIQQAAGDRTAQAAIRNMIAIVKFHSLGSHKERDDYVRLVTDAQARYIASVVISCGDLLIDGRRLDELWDEALTEAAKNLIK